MSLLLAILLAACSAEQSEAGNQVQAAASPVVDGAGRFPALTGRVVDRAELLDAQEEARLSQQLARVEREVGPQFVVVTIPTLQGQSIEAYGVDLGRRWGIGSRERNDGLLLIVAPNERKVRIEVGYGLERRVTDPYAARVLEEKVLPRFRENDLRGGIFAGVDALVERLRSRLSDQEIRTLDGVIT